MALTLILILLGTGLGGLSSGLLALYFVTTRAYRGARSMVVFALGYLCILGTFVGALLLMFKGQVLLSVAPGSSQDSQDHVALYAYTASLVCGVSLVGRSEIRWRRSVGLHDKTLLPTRRKE
jgi:hypothetical protein